MTGDKPPWYPLFADELDRSYPDPTAYVTGSVPDYTTWNDARAHLPVQSTPGTDLDRRVWTWEVRLNTGPDATDYEAIVLSHEALKQVEDLHAHGYSIPDRVKVIFGPVSSSGVHHFLGQSVFDALGGDR